MEYTPRQLREMDDDEAERELTKQQWDRREKLLDLLDEAAENEQRIEEQNQRVDDIVVHADPEQLGTRVDIYGNDVLVRIDSENRAFRDAIESLDAKFGDDDREIDDVPEGELDDIAGYLTTMLDEILIEWNGHEWGELREDKRANVLATARQDWGVDGLMLAWGDIAAAVAEDREERVGVVEQFRPEGRGRDN